MKRQLSKSDLTGAFWFLSAAVAFAFFAVFVQRYFSREWFGLIEILGFLAFSVLMGVLFAAMWLWIVGVAFGLKASPPGANDTAHVHAAPKLLAIPGRIEIQGNRLLWREQVHVAAISFIGIPWTALRAICLALLAVAPSIVYLLKANAQIAVVESPTIGIAVFVLGLLGVLFLLASAVLFRAVHATLTASRGSNPSKIRISREQLEVEYPDSRTIPIPWNNIDRVVNTSQIVGLIAHDRRAIFIPRRAVDMKIVGEIKEVVRSLDG